MSSLTLSLYPRTLFCHSLPATHACVHMLNDKVASKLLQMHLREEYEDLLDELARGQPRDGVKGRPLGSRVTVLSSANTLLLAVSLARPLALSLFRARTHR